MNTLSYHIVVRTPVGIRIGDISFDFVDEEVRGNIKAPYFEPDFYGNINKDDTLLLYMTVVDEKEQKEYEAIGRISMYAIHISVPAAAFTYEIDGTSSRTSIR